ncbi:MAG TPA: hypothetical protein VFM82_04080 [Flavobacteriaceae bacterium]|nr:hypothetical protein [Flavobacteriaceae bacterium]
MKKITAVIILFLLVACGNSKKEDQPEKTTATNSELKTVSVHAEKFAQRLERVHQKEIFQEKGMAEFRMHFDFPEKEKMEQKVQIATDSTLIRLDRENQIAIFNGKEIYISAKDSADVQTYLKLASLFRFPYTLSDPNKKWDSKAISVPDENIQAIKFTYTEEPSVLQSPWYVVYSDKRTDLLKGVAFVAPNFKEGKPIAVLFEKYITVKSVPVATSWKVYSWDEANGIGNELLGSIKISDISFPDFDESVFERK